MYAVLLTLATLGIGPGEENPRVKGAAPPLAGHIACDHCGGQHGHNSGCLAEHHAKHLATKSQRNMMPQHCYDPLYGCYRGSRFMHRHSAFHGTFYRRPYNYRNYFDYPWHAELHEPTSLFSYNVEGEQRGDDVPPPPPGGSAPQRSTIPPPSQVPTDNGESVLESGAIGTGVFRGASRTSDATSSRTEAQPASSSRRQASARSVALPRFHR